MYLADTIPHQPSSHVHLTTTTLTTTSSISTKTATTPSSSSSSYPASLHHLPSLPTLPPLQMPTYDSLRNDAPLTALSHASEDSFTTALSVSPPPPLPASGPLSSTSTFRPPSPSSSQRHRVIVKSKSVDSFVKVHRTSPHASSPIVEHSLQGQSSAQSNVPLNSATDRRSSSRPRSSKQHNRMSVASYLGFSGKTRPRNKLKSHASGRSATDDDRDSPLLDDSDFDSRRPRIANEGVSTFKDNNTIPKNNNNNIVGNNIHNNVSLSQSIVKTRNHPSSSSNESRSRTAAANLPAINTNILPTKYPPRPLSKPSISQAPPTTSPPMPPADVQRTRSHSVGAQAEDIRRRVLTRPHSDTHAAVGQNAEGQELAFGVVGAPGCGKSTFIRKSLKRRKKSSPEVCTASIFGGSKYYNITYTRSSAYVPVTSDSDIRVSLYEVDVKSLQNEENECLFSVWPPGLPRVDGVFVCYDASDANSFKHITDLLAGYHNQATPTIVLACKSDLQKLISPNDALLIVQPYAGIIEVSSETDSGKSKMRRCVDVFVKLALKSRAVVPRTENEPYRNPASPDVLNANHAPWNNTPTNTTSSSASSFHEDTDSPPEVQSDTNQPITITTLSAFRSPSAPSSPTRARSLNDMVAEQQLSIATALTPASASDKNKSSSVIDLTGVVDESSESLRTAPHAASASPYADDYGYDHKSDDMREQPPPPWATFEELSDKLFFLAVSGDDPSFISYFFLTFRRFSTPRSVLLGMQKRMLELNNTMGDYMLAAFAQQRICALLEQWMNEYPTDFAAPGTAGALSAFIKQILTHTHTLNYGSDFLPFLDSLPNLVDEDAAWAKKFEDSTAESDESDSLFGEDNESDDTEVESPSSFSPHPNDVSDSNNSPQPSSRERKSSLPLSAKAFLHPTRPVVKEAPLSRPSPKEILARLYKASQSLAYYDAQTIALEITRRELELFLKIERRHWLRHTLVPGKKDPSIDPVAKFNNHYNDLHRWAVSLILCHDKPKMRAKQIEKFAEIALRLRSLNNYSGMRAIITAINQSTYTGDLPMEIFKTTKPELHKKFLSSDILLRTTGSHQSYRMALRNTKGPCIPSVEVHTSDLHRAHEGNPDNKLDDPTKIHWAKFNMIGKFVATTTQLQEQCCGPNGYNIPENQLVGSLFDVPIMDYDMQQSRMYPPTDDSADVYAPHILDATHSREGSGIRRLFFW